MIEIYIEKLNKRIEMEIDPQKTVEDLLNILNINKETVIVAIDKKIVLEKTKISSAKKIDILAVVSGG